MNYPKLDHRTREELHRELASLARSYTPEWRYEQPDNDPGAALAELFCTMFGETVDRMNALPEKLYTEFLNQIGFREPGPVSARGAMRFSPYNTATDPVPVPMGTQVFAPDEQGENIVFETSRPIEATPASIADIYFADSAKDCIERLDRSRPLRFFAQGCGEPIQRHCLELGQQDALRLDGPCTISVELSPDVPYQAQEAAQALAQMNWSFYYQGETFPFDSVREENGRILLEKKDALALEENQSGKLVIVCEGQPSRSLLLERAYISSTPVGDYPAQSLFFNDLPILMEEGGYCFGQQPTPYGLFYIRSDAAFSKRGAQARLRLDLTPVIREPDRQMGSALQYTQSIIDKKNEVEAKPDDVYVAGVTWEYFNGVGWRRLEVRGDRNPFSCQREGALETVFKVPRDLTPIEVNAERGYYIRARVTEVAHQFSVYQRWILPFVKNAELTWRYDEAPLVDWVGAWNNGNSTVVEQADQYPALGVRAIEPMTAGPQCMYFRFDQSPHAMPLSLGFFVQGRTAMNEQLQWECWNGKSFEAVRGIDMTENLLQSAQVFLFLPERLPKATFFGQEGCWLRLCRSGMERDVPAPVVLDLQPNIVTVVQRQRQPEQTFDTQVYEAGKAIQLLSAPVQECEVWVDEQSALSADEAAELARRTPDRFRLEWEDHQMGRRWVRWDIVPELALWDGEARVCVLDPYTGVIRFGNGRQGRVPPSGNHNIRVRYASGGGTRGNLPAGTVSALLGGLPRISSVVNITPMSGGTGRISREQVESRGNRLLRNRGRAGSRRDYEDIVVQAFPQVRHVRCFSGQDETGAAAPGHVCVVLVGSGEAGDGVEELCRQVYQHLAKCGPCCLAAEGRLHVCPATVLTVNSQVLVQLEKPELAAQTQQELVRRISALIDKTWKGRPIGSQIRIDEVWRTVRETPNVALIDQILVEGAYDRGGQPRLVPLERDTDFPYGVAENGLHQIRVR